VRCLRPARPRHPLVVFNFIMFACVLAFVVVVAFAAVAEVALIATAAAVRGVSRENKHWAASAVLASALAAIVSGHIEVDAAEVSVVRVH
jgi:hypothetical protein